MPAPKSLQVDIDFNQSKKRKYSENLMIALKQEESEANPVLIPMSTKRTSSSFKIKSASRERQNSLVHQAYVSCILSGICNSNSTETPLYKTKGLLDANKKHIYNTLRNKIK